MGGQLPIDYLYLAKLAGCIQVNWFCRVLQNKKSSCIDILKLFITGRPASILCGRKMFFGFVDLLMIYHHSIGRIVVIKNNQKIVGVLAIQPFVYIANISTCFYLFLTTPKQKLRIADIALIIKGSLFCSVRSFSFSLGWGTK